MQVLLKLGAIDLGTHLVSVPGLERQLGRVENELTGLFDVLVADDWLNGCVGVVDKELIDRFEWDFCLIVLVGGVQAKDGVLFLLRIVVLAILDLFWLVHFQVLQLWYLFLVDSLCGLAGGTHVGVVFVLAALAIILLEDKLLILAQQLNVILFAGGLTLAILTVSFHHALHGLRHAKWVCLRWDHVVSQVRNKVTISRLLLNKLVRVDASGLLEVRFKCWLPR